nr:putative ribonuclease H-like domain-containing protein [Tanacetum cinerariifolium]
MKRLITELPSLMPPYEKETFYAYLEVSAEAVSIVLLTDRKGRQCPVQYVSRTLNEAERNYAPMEKLALSLIHMTQRLRRYFEAHPVKVITDQPIKNILNNTETSGKLAKYAVELGAYNIMFIPHNVVKGQVLADFLSEAPEGTKEDLYFWMPEVTAEKDKVKSWTLFIDGASSPKGSGACLVLIGPSGIEYTYALHITFLNTNNEAEYEALLAGLRIARQMNISNIKVKVDSKLVASQINKTYETSKDIMIKYLAKAREYVSGFKSFLIENIPRNMNQKADVLSKLASVAFNHLTKEEGYNEEEMRLNLDLLQESREAAAIREGKYKTKMKQYYNKKVRPEGFRLGEFVFRRNEASRIEDQGKLGPKWEGPYRVIKAYDNGSHKLQTLEDKEVPRTWHAINLRKCYM